MSPEESMFPQKRLRDERYLRWVRKLPCALSGYTEEIEATHVRMFSGTAIKPPDNHVLPLRSSLHRMEHEMPARFWELAMGWDRGEVIRFAMALHDLYPDTQKAEAHLAIMQLRADPRLIVAANDRAARTVFMAWANGSGEEANA